MCSTTVHHPLGAKEATQQDAKKVKFLQSISTVCEAARDRGFSRCLKEFYHQLQVAETIKVRGYPVALGKGPCRQAAAHCEDRAQAGTSVCSHQAA